MRAFCRISCLFLALASASWGQLKAEDPARSAQANDRIARLINDLGSDEFAIREAASDELARLGLTAVGPLQAASTNADREIRLRSQRVLGLIRQQDVERRLQAFLRHQEEVDDDPLPGWGRFQKTYGDSESSRDLFIQMQRADAPLMQSLEAGPRSASAVLTQRTAQNRQTQQGGGEQLSLGQVAAALFVAAEEDVSVPAPTLTILLTQCYQQSIRGVLSGRGQQDIPRKMLGTIIRRSDDLAAYQAMNVAYQFNMTEGIVPAQKILSKQGSNRSPPMAQLALMTVARLGDASQLPIVERLLTDSTQLSRMQENATIYDLQVRDAALATAVILTKQDLKAYFDIPPKQPLSDPQMIFFNARVIGFTNEKQREAVFKKWDEYKARQAKSKGDGAPNQKG
jgi:hypothetical protein